MHEAFMAVVIMGIIMLVPIIGILTRHQQKMAEIMSRNRLPVPNPEIQELRKDMADLKALVHQQAIAMDSLISLQTRMTPDVQQRLEQPGGPGCLKR